MCLLEPTVKADKLVNPACKFISGRAGRAGIRPLKSPVIAVRSLLNVLASVEASVSKPANKSLFILSSLDIRLLNFSLAPAKPAVIISAIASSPYGPANTFSLPLATEVQPVTLSPTLPHPFPLTNTVVDPVVIGFACSGQGAGGFLCNVFLSSCLLMPVPLTLTLLLRSSLKGTAQ